MNKAIGLVTTLLLCSSLVHAIEPGDAAPGFELPRLAGNGTAALGDYAGKVVYVDFWASWCAPCRESLPLMNQLRATLLDRGFEVLAVNVDEDADEGRRFLETYAVDYTVLSDQAASVAAAYGLVTMPTSFLVDKNGIVVYVHKGFKAADVARIRKLIEDELDGN